MIKRILKLFKKKQIKKLVENDPEVRQSLINIHKAGNDLHKSMKKHEEEYGKYFK